jgi:predicted hydrolase (HD superfamily)
MLCPVDEFTKSDAYRHAWWNDAPTPKVRRDERRGITGLLHDFDYESTRRPDHPMKGSEVLGERATRTDPEATRHVLRSRSAHVQDGEGPHADELCGFIHACSLVRPNKISDLEVSSVKKKMKDKAFARNVSREDIHQGTAELGVPLEEHVQFVITAMRGIAPELGLA